MRGRFGFVLIVIFGSFFVYCAQNAVGDMRGGGGGGMVGNAGADACCTPPDPPPGTVLFDQKFMTSVDCASPAIDVAGNRTIVIHGNAPTIEWSFGGAAGWVPQTSATNTQGVTVLDGRMGKQVRISYPYYPPGSGSCMPQEQSLTVVGYKQ